MRYSPVPLVFLAVLAACSSEPNETAQGAVTSFALPQHDTEAMSVERAITQAMPGKIDPPDAAWQQTGNGAEYGEPGQIPLIELSCHHGLIEVTRNRAADDGAKALLAFVGYRGILRLKVANDGTAWRGSLASDNPDWRAVTGGPFYATVAGGGKVISPASSVAATVITECRDALPEPATNLERENEAGADA